MVGVFLDACMYNIRYDGKYIDASVSFVGAGFGIGWEKGVFKIKADLVGFPGLEISINFRQFSKIYLDGYGE